MWQFFGAGALFLTVRAGAHIAMVALPFALIWPLGAWAAGSTGYGSAPGTAYVVLAFAVVPAVALHAWLSVVSGHSHRWISPGAAVSAWWRAAKSSRGRALATAWVVPLLAMAAASLAHPQWVTYAPVLVLTAGIASALGGLVAGAWLTDSEQAADRDASGLERLVEVALGVANNPNNPLEIWREGQAVVARVPAGAVGKLAGAEARVEEHFPAWEVENSTADFIRLRQVTDATRQRREAVIASGGLAAEIPAAHAEAHVPPPVYAAAPGEAPTPKPSGPLDFTDA